MTPKARRDAILELKDMALEYEQRANRLDGADFRRSEKLDRAAMLRDVVAELARVPEA